MTIPLKLALVRTVYVRCDCKYRPHKYLLTIPIPGTNKRKTILTSDQVQPANGVQYQHGWEARYRIEATTEITNWNINPDLFSWLNESGIAYCYTLSQLHARLDSLIQGLIKCRFQFTWEISDAVCSVGIYGTGNPRFGRTCPNCYAVVLQSLAEEKQQPITICKAPDWLEIRTWTPSGQFQVAQQPELSIVP